jgi:hypothetical protein
MLLLSWLVPLIGVFFIIRLGARLAEVTGRAKWLGTLCTLPPLTFYGLTAMALTAKSLASP